MPPPEFKTKLRFEPSKLSTTILKKYLVDILNDTEAETLLSCEAPSQYTRDPDNFTNYRVLKEMGLMAIKDWKSQLEKNNGDVECLYLVDDMVATDARCFYESWKVIQEEVGNHEKQMSFFRLISEIVANLSQRNYVDITMEGEQHTVQLENMVKMVAGPRINFDTTVVNSALPEQKSNHRDNPLYNENRFGTISEDIQMEQCFPESDNKDTLEEKRTDDFFKEHDSSEAREDIAREDIEEDTPDMLGLW